MLQVRIADFDGSNPVILEQAKNRSYSKSVNSSDEGISFDIAKNAPKADVLNPDTDGYKRRWEVWETNNNTRLNYGPITSIVEAGTDWKVVGAGRSALLADFRKTQKTFYAPIESVVNNIRYENYAAEPRTTTIVSGTEPFTTADNRTFGAAVIIDEKYHGLSKNTKDNAIDDDTGLFRPGDIERPNSFYTTDSFWSGMSRSDTHIVDLGDDYPVSRVDLILPAWGGGQRLWNRSYDFELAYAIRDRGGTRVQGRSFGPFHVFYTSDTPNMFTGGISLYVGLVNGTVVASESVIPNSSPVTMRFVRTRITSVHAWAGTHFDDDPSVDGWASQCDPDYVPGSIPGLTAKIQVEEINTRTLEAANDCHASIKEIAIQGEIIGLDRIVPVGLQRIDNNNFQITYTHSPTADETVDTDAGFRKFEPGGFFRKVSFSWTGANTAYTKFYDTDCTNCFPSGFNFGIMDDNNSLVYATDSTSGFVARTFGAYTSHILMKGAADASVTSVDSWPAQTDPLSYGGSYSYTTVTGDHAVIHFKGASFKWYATVPDDETGANVTVSIRHKDTSGTWTAYTTLSTFTIPDNISAQAVYEITYESGILDADTVYEIKITNNDGGYCSIDSIEGFWAASLVHYNEDSSRIIVSRPEAFKQIYDKRFSGGSMYKVISSAWAGFEFEGDRVILVSAKGHNHGKASIIIFDRSLGTIYDPGVSNHVFIPGGDPDDGSLTIDLDTGKRGNEIPQYILFDSNQYFPSGLEWKKYAIYIFLLRANSETYAVSTIDNEFDSFVPRCKDCVADTSPTVNVTKPIFLDGIYAHEVIGLSVAFEQEAHLEMLKSTAEALQVEWNITEAGIRLEPRVGTDTEIYLREGQNTLVEWEIVNDISQMATILISHGADIDGLPLYAITEDKNTRTRLGRTVMRDVDFRNIADYQQLIGISRGELKRRSYPQKRITVTHIASDLALNEGDSFLLWTRKMGAIRVRIMRMEISETAGRIYNLECITWPQIT
jgi:hypothetical protein